MTDLDSPLSHTRILLYIFYHILTLAESIQIECQSRTTLTLWEHYEGVIRHPVFSYCDCYLWLHSDRELDTPLPSRRAANCDHPQKMPFLLTWQIPQVCGATYSGGGGGGDHRHHQRKKNHGSESSRSHRMPKALDYQLIFFPQKNKTGNTNCSAQDLTVYNILKDKMRAEGSIP